MSNSETGLSLTDVLSAAAVIAAFLSVYFASKAKRFSDKSLFYMEEQFRLSHGQKLNQYVSEACEQLGKNGTTVLQFIDSIQGITENDKETVWYQTMLRVKGKPPEKTFSEEIMQLRADAEEKQPWLAEKGDIFACNRKCFWSSKLWVVGEEYKASGSEEVPYHFNLVRGNAKKKPFKKLQPH